MSDWAPRRIECAGGCGLWWYQQRIGRPRRWCPRCYRKHRSFVNHGVGTPAPPLGWWKRPAITTTFKPTNRQPEPRSLPSETKVATNA